MNVSKEHLMILLLSKNSGEKFYGDFFGTFSFFKENIPLSKKNFSLGFKEFNNTESYKIIACVDNPYRIVYEQFLINSSENFKKKNLSLDKQKEEFSYWFEKIFYNDIDYLDDNCALHQLVFLTIQDFANEKIEYIVKKESYIQDLNKIPFVDISKINNKLSFLMEVSFNYKKIITIGQAKKIYNFYKLYFDKFDFNPFSFSDKEFTLKEKVNFIHL